MAADEFYESMRIRMAKSEVDRICDDGDAELISWAKFIVLITYFGELGIHSENHRSQRREFLGLLKASCHVARKRALDGIREQASIIRREGIVETLDADLDRAKTHTKVANQFTVKEAVLDQAERVTYAERLAMISNTISAIRSRRRRLCKSYRGLNRLEEALKPLKTEEPNRFYKRTLYPAMERLKLVRVKRSQIRRRANMVLQYLDNTEATERMQAMNKLRNLRQRAEGSLIISETAKTGIKKSSQYVEGHMHESEVLAAMREANKIQSDLENLMEEQLDVMASARALAYDIAQSAGGQVPPA
ncbi:hypothetical protein C8Q77DRAFT_1076963 [Trametes polyzona]|nr:hypothetical protein C8Q77DRAFT_1076956 [Trametes polyzona]KAI0628151.1 hypothetical protein C8Q77DRAFT_1076963 [Trametes polyzona]